MAEQNFALEVDPADESLSLNDFDVEAGLRSSRRHLIHNFEEEPGRSTSASIKKSIKSSVRKTKYYCYPFVKAIKYILNKSKLLIVITLYSIFGAWLFTTLEVPHDLAVKEEAYHARLIARDVMILNLRAIYYSKKEDREERWKDAILQFEKDLDLGEPAIETDWTFWMAFLYAGTIYTTIGYGNIACKTKGGQIATLLYAVVGIPIMIIILNDLGDFLLHVLEWLANTSSDTILFLGVRWGVVKLEENSKRRKRFLAFRAKLARHGIINASSSLTIDSILTHPNKSHDNAEQVKPDPPVLSAIFATVGWLLLAARVFCLWEDWSFFTSVYFFFISCSTIGLGDVVPAHPEYMIFAFGVVMVGLSLVTVCIDVVQKKLEMMYMELLKKILSDYMAAVESGDMNAAQDMMAGFTGASKFLLPFISKNQGAKVMTQFREDCEAQGIEPPAVLVNINPNTGKPAFASANKEEYKDYIEHAEEKRQEERKIEENKLLSKSAQMAKPQIQTKAFGVQASFDVSINMVEKTSYGMQAGPEYSDEEVQTSDCESVDEGIQTWPSVESIACQYDAVQMKDSMSQYDLVEEKPEYTDTGIQPDVSSIFIFEDSEQSDYQSDDSNPEYEDDDLEFIPDDLLDSDHLTVEMPSFQRLQKSISVESQETVIHVTPTGSPTTSRKLAIQKLKEMKEKKRKEIEMLREERRLRKNLRYMKSSGNQTSVEFEDVAAQVECQYMTSATQSDEKIMSEASTQFLIEKRGRRIQTKLTCLNAANLSKKNTKQGFRQRQGTGTQFYSIASSVTSIDHMDSSSSLEDRGTFELTTEPQERVSKTVAEPFREAENVKDDVYFDEKLQGGSSEDIVWSLSNDDDLPTEEISINVCLISRAVDEEGEYVFDEFDMELDDDVFLSDDDMPHDDLEMFAMTTSTQTDQIFEDMDCQTDPQIYAEELNLIRMELEHHLRETISQELEQKALESRAITNEISAQTNSSSFYAVQQTGLPTIFESSFEDHPSPTETPEPPVYHFLADSICQTTPVRSFSSVCQTDLVDSIETRSRPVMFSTDIQTSFEVVEEEVQTNREEKEDEETQTLQDNTENETQTPLIISAECSSQTETADPIEKDDVEIQTATAEHTTGETQTLLSISYDPEDVAVQTIQELKVSGCQTDKVIQMTRDMQTEKVRRDQKRSQTDPIPPSDEGRRSLAIDATQPVATVEMQSEVSMFMVDEATAAQLQDKHDVRFNVEKGTSMEEKQLKHMYSQSFTVETDAVGVQVMPSLTTSHTQHTYSCLSDEFTQTDTYTKTKASQEVESADSETQNYHENLNVQGEILDEEIAVQIDSNDIEDITVTAPVLIQSTANLWSDFDQLVTYAGIDSPVQDMVVRVDVQSQTVLDVEAIEELIRLHILSDQDVKLTEEEHKKGTEGKPSLKDLLDILEKAKTLKKKKGEGKSVGIRKRPVHLKKSKALPSTSRVGTSQIDSMDFENQSPSVVSTSFVGQVSSADFDNAEAQTQSIETRDIDDQVQSTEVSPEDVNEYEIIVQHVGLPAQDQKQKGADTRKTTKKVRTRTMKNEETSTVSSNMEEDKHEVEEVRIQPHQVEEVEVQAVVDTRTIGIGQEGRENWKEVYVAELDLERRQRMLDIGIQTGVLARVQHMYGRKDYESTESEMSTGEYPRVNLRKTESSEYLRRSQESLARTNSVMSIAESFGGDESSPGPSKPTSRSSSFKKTKRSREQQEIRDSTVADLRSRFEETEKKREKRPRSSSNER